MPLLWLASLWSECSGLDSPNDKKEKLEGWLKIQIQHWIDFLILIPSPIFFIYLNIKAAFWTVNHLVVYSCLLKMRNNEMEGLKFENRNDLFRFKLYFQNEIYYHWISNYLASHFLLLIITWCWIKKMNEIEQNSVQYNCSMAEIIIHSDTS